MTQRTRAALVTEISNLLPDNTSGDISPSDLRSVTGDLADSALFREDGAAIEAALDATIGSGWKATAEAMTVEEVQDEVAAMFAAGTQTRATVTYDDNDGSLSITVDDMSGGGGASVDDTAYAASWDGVTSTAPSKNAVYDQFQTVLSALGGKVGQAEVDAAVAALVDSSPTTLDTLNELAAALGDDPDFATTTATQLGLKANAADLGTAAVADASDFATAAQGDLADNSVQSDPTGIPGFSRVTSIYAADTEQARTDWEASGVYDPQALVIVE